jgi:hypothetical protein
MQYGKLIFNVISFATLVYSLNNRLLVKRADGLKNEVMYTRNKLTYKFGMLISAYYAF